MEEYGCNSRSYEPDYPFDSQYVFEEDKREKCPSGNITIPESEDSSSDETLHSGDPQNLPILSVTPLIDPEASTPDLSDAEDSNCDTKADDLRILNTEDDIHECYMFSSIVAKTLCKIEKTRRQECMHEILHLLMENCRKGD